MKHPATVPALALVLLAPWAARSAEVTENFKINSDGTEQIHNEEQIAVSPLDGDTVVAVWRDFRLGYRRVGVGTSHDGGRTWLDRLLPDVDYPRASDPGLCADSQGNFYAHTLALSNGPAIAGVAIQVFKSRDGGDTFLDPVDAARSPFGLLDKQMIACDRSGGTTDGTVHLAWYDVSRGIRTTRSEDGGVTFLPLRQVSNSGSVQWPVPAPGLDGRVYIGWLNFSESALKLDVSSDGGDTWGADTTIAPLLITNEPLNGGVDVLSYPALMVDVTDGPRRGTVYAAYMDRLEAGGDTDVFLRRSADDGASWSEPVRVNDDPTGNGADQFHPWLVVDEAGVVNVIWLDRRDDPSNLDWHAYVARSFDGGETFTPNVRVSTASSSPTGGSTIAAGLIGEYIGIDSLGGDLYTVWTDTRDGQQDVYSAPVVGLDSDDDGAADVADNCPALANPLQRDGDGDGLGNECDDDADGDGVENDADSDDDDDGVADGADCAPLDALVSDVPGESAGLVFTGRTSVAWDEDPTGASTSYRLDRGTLPGTGFDDYDHACLSDGMPGPASEDAAPPPAGDGFYYLALGENCFGTGSPGNADAGERPTGPPCP